MNREEILKLLASLGIKVSADGADGTMKEDDAVKLVEEQFKASNLGLLNKRDELLAEVVATKRCPMLSTITLNPSSVRTPKSDISLV
jgi:hypothetical protein